ncbi:replication protein A 70 kDa DNA-binding subunit isoform X2 [Prorops nasuta]|uniref:replication protein A 70 kDa DNA-binding subunit isoform X2 n=1 Tax=Prorops nasuta TaxID=863751 RepID=UPI0034CF9F5D
MYSLSEGALDEIMNGVDIAQPILQMLGHKRLGGPNSTERYRLLLSDGKRINSFTMLATQLNELITENILTEFSICQVNRYAISTVNNSGSEKRVMVILSLDIKVPGDEVGYKIGNPTNNDNGSSSENRGEKRIAGEKPDPTLPLKKVHTNTDVIAGLDHLKPGNMCTVPIAALSPYQNKWVIKARVTNKSNIRTWSNARGEGKLFSMDLLDESGEIRCTAFRDQCDKFFDMIEVGKVYYISKCSIKSANKQFCNLNNEYEMALNNDSEIIPCQEESEDIPKIQFNFEPISSVGEKSDKTLIDILGVVKSVGEIQTILQKSTGKTLEKRDIQLVDESNTMICLTLWRSQALDFDGSNNPVVAIKGAAVREYNGGKTISLLFSSIIQLDPDIPEAHRLRGWFNSTGHNKEIKSLSNVTAGGASYSQCITFKEAKDLQLGLTRTDYYNVIATVNMIRVENCLYKACPTEACMKKLVDQSNDMYRCEKCCKEFPNYKYRIILNMSISDSTGSQWVTGFNEEAEKLVGLSSNDLGELQETDNDAYLEKFANATFKTYLFKLRVKMERFSDEARLRTSIISASPLDFVAYNEQLIIKLKKLLSISNA